MPFSPELTALCQSQLKLLGQFASSAQGVIYLAEAGREEDERNWYPIASYPNFSATQTVNQRFLLMSDRQNPFEENPIRPLGKTLFLQSPGAEEALEMGLLPQSELTEDSDGTPDSPLLHQVVLPLQQERFVLGILVVSRGDRDWHESEYFQLEQVAQTLTWARLMDRRLQWLQEQLQQREVEAQRHQDILDMLLHQIRNPLTALKTFGKLLLRRFAPQDQNLPIAEGIVKESDRLQFLVQQLQDQLTVPEVLALTPMPPEPELEKSPLALPSSEPLPGLKPLGLMTETIDLGEILSPLLAAAGAIADDREIQLTSYLPDHCPSIRADASSLREVISNVLDNALKYTPRGGAVAVRWQRGEDCSGWQWVIVSDTGPGIPPQDLPYLFQRHYRGVQEGGNIPGTGLGLALAWDWMERMGGRLEVISPAGIWRPILMSETAGMGAAFRLWLPEIPEIPNIL